ncbi:hypothetical protein CW711_01970 [Candidatus Bathyarchaeota archaeon]|mgnify:FL=1|nr:MAG: hypothetical protein B6U84_02070 [Candidatus Bathyarchaeota archaeon ex4484_40]RJS68162.1 MAG: hypothetical protein CW680_00145 [Candidatus Bathyarchaeota archaeon]RJS79729.1 MAG: hypothetical protein CW711_01970 [Candidatus Bathyarchaeota archaeon]RLG94168.1 MAG: hypothetical protein DRO29_06845 [Candidatus Bathyarchaeota archaeon]HDJ04806.1 hypothetical protein [Candidatus Bathyarchaeota archaeon]
MKENGLELSVKYKDMEVKFSGTPEDVIRSFFRFMSKILPAYDLASNLVLTVDLENLLRSVAGIIALTPEGPVITVPREKIGGEKNVILLHLLKAYIGYQTGRLEKDSLSTAEILSLTGGKAGTVAARLSELTSLGWVERIGRGEYRITTLGIVSFMEETLPKIKL